MPEDFYYEQPQPNYIPPMEKSDRADIIDKIRPEKVVELLRYKLMGMEGDDKGRWVLNETLQRNAISAVGAWQLSNLVLGVSNSSTPISKLNDKEIKLRAFHLTDTAIKMMLSNWRDYGINNISQIEYVADIIFSISFIVLKQPENEGIRRMITGTRSETHHVQETSEKRGGFLFRRNR